MAAELSYYTIFSIAPLLVVLINSLSYFVPPHQVKSFVLTEMQRQLGNAGTNEVSAMIDGLLNLNQGFLSNSFMLIFLAFISSTMFVTLQRSLNKIFGVKNIEGYRLLRQLKKRATAFAVIVGLAFSLMVSLLINALLITFDNRLDRLFPENNFFIVEITNWVLPIAGPLLLFVVFYNYLPEKKVNWKSAWKGAGIAALLFYAGKWIIALYLSHSEIMSIYGATGSIIALLSWVYYSSIIFFFGAELVHWFESRRKI